MLKLIPKKKIALLLGDILIIALSIYVAPFVRYKIIPDPLTIFSPSNIVAVLVYIFVLYVCDLYNFEERISKSRLAFKFIVAILIISIVNAALFYLLHLRLYSSWVLFISSSLALISLIIWRLVFISLTGIAKNPLRVLIFGAGKTGQTLYDVMKTNDDYQVIGFADDNGVKQGLMIDNLPILGKSDDLLDLIKQYEINKVIVATSDIIKPSVFKELVYAKFNGVSIYEMPTFYEKIAGKIPVLHTSNIWMGYADIYGLKNNIYNTKLKNVLDKTIASICLIISLPLMILVALLIKLESKGPILYKQKRMGWDEKEFNLIKFRSMQNDAEANGAVWAEENDSRVTQVGKFIRFLRIDELPQLWNVLKGEMSIVGPRPERPEFVNNLKEEIPYYTLRHSLKPGITGWAQINYSYGASKKDALEKLQYDLYYIKNASFLLDAYIILRTLTVIMLGLGAR